ncbi:MAG: hypothetical protein AAGA58_01635 [Verrucomicrobiota bacterium]
MGYYSTTVPAGNSLLVPALVTANDFCGAMTGLVSGSPTSTINQTGAGWTPGQFDNHYVEITESGSAWEGLVLDIVSNGTDSVVISGDTGASGFNLNGDEQYCIRRHATLGTLFPGGGGFQGFTDILIRYDSDGSPAIFLWDSNNNRWSNANFNENEDDEIVYPGQGLLLVVLTSKTITIGGNDVSTVKTNRTMVNIYGNQVVNLVGLMNPLVNQNPLLGDHNPSIPNDPGNVAEIEQVLLGDSGLRTSPFDPFTDLFLLFSLEGALSTSGLYVIDGGGNISENGTTVANDDPIRNGAAFLVVSGSDTFYTQPALADQ